MKPLVACLLVVVATLLLIPVAVFCIEVVAAIALPKRQLGLRPGDGVRRRLAVLVPAHNESTGLLPTLADIKSQLIPGDRLVVIADNCTDDTAAIARAADVEVIERRDNERRGKGYALDFGLRYLSSSPPETVIFVDADCRVEPSTIDQLALTAAATDRPVQALHTMASPDKSLVNNQVAEFAGRVKLSLRQLGLSALRAPCMLMGTGMAFPWDVVRLADFASGSIVEDLRLGLELTLAGYSPLYCPSACVKSEFPSSTKGVRTQRKRWEQGHIDMILKDAFRLFCQAIARRNWRLLMLTLDLTVPPLSLLVMLVTGVFSATLLAAFFGISSVALAISTATLLLFLAAFFLVRGCKMRSRRSAGWLQSF